MTGHGRRPPLNVVYISPGDAIESETSRRAQKIEIRQSNWGR